MDNEDSVAEAIVDVFTSPNVGLMGANIVDVIGSLATSAKSIAAAITPPGAICQDANGGHVGSLTEAIMGVSAGLLAIAQSIDSLAGAVRDHDISLDICAPIDRLADAVREAGESFGESQ